jgi:hypothetical protein
MRVKLCARCLYQPRDLEDRCDPVAALHVCAKCDGVAHQPRPTRCLCEVTMRDNLQCLRNGAAKRCAICNGNFGLISSRRARTATAQMDALARFVLPF